MPAPNLPAVYDPLDPAIQAQSWLARDAFNTVNGVQGVALPEAQHAIEPTAEGTNGQRACIKSFCDYVQGLTPITALQIATYFRLPRYTTAQLTDPLAVSQGAGATAYNTDTGSLVTSNGTTWAAAGGIASLGNGAAASVLGVAGASPAARADIVGTGTASVPAIMSHDGSTVAFRTLSVLGDGLQTLVDQDLTALATNAFADGAETIGALEGNAGGTANAGANWGIVNGTGLRLSSTGGTWNSGTTTGPHWYCTVSSIPGWRSGKSFIVDLVITAGTFAAGNDQLRFGLWGIAGQPLGTNSARMRMGIRGNVSGNQQVACLADTSVQTAGANVFTPLAVSAWIEMNGRVMVGIGTYSGGWPRFDYVVSNNAASIGIDQIMSSTCRFAIGLNTSAGTPAIDVTRWRIRQD